MADINLLQASQPNEKQSVRWMRYFNITSYVILGLAVIGAGAAYFITNKSSQQKYQLISQMNDQVSAIQNLKDYQTLIASQVKVANLNYLLNSHVDWTQVLPKFFAATYKGTSFNRFSVNDQDGSDIVSISGTVPSFVDLDKMIQGFQLADFNSYIRDVKLVNVGLSAAGDHPGISFSMNITFNRDLLKFKAQNVNPVQVQPVNQTIPATPQAPAPAPAQSPTN